MKTELIEELKEASHYVLADNDTCMIKVSVLDKTIKFIQSLTEQESKVSAEEINSINSSMSEMFRQHDYRAMYEFYQKSIKPILQTYAQQNSDAVEFAEWVSNEFWVYQGGSVWFNKHREITTKELYQQFLNREEGEK